MSDATDDHDDKGSGTAIWWLLFVIGCVASIALAYVLVHDRNRAEMHKGEGQVIAKPRSGH